MNLVGKIQKKGLFKSVYIAGSIIRSRSNKIISPVKNFLLIKRNRKLSHAFSVKSHLTVEERITLYELSISKFSILEIGSYLGASACCFGLATQESGQGKVFCIDTWRNDAMSEGNWDTLAEFTKNTAPFSKFIVPVRGFSTEVVDQIVAQVDYLDLIFIDGDHSYEGVKADWEAYKHFLRPGSVVVFHDSGWADGVKQVIEENAKPIMTNFGSLPNMWWGTVRY